MFFGGGIVLVGRGFGVVCLLGGGVGGVIWVGVYWGGWYARLGCGFVLGVRMFVGCGCWEFWVFCMLLFLESKCNRRQCRRAVEILMV